MPNIGTSVNFLSKVSKKEQFLSGCKPAENFNFHDH